MIAYVAGPYTHPDPDVRQQRYVEHAIAAAKLADMDRFAVFSPIAYGHSLCMDGGLVRLDHEFWMRQCLPFLHASDVLIVLDMDGLKASAGTKVEIEEAQAAGIPIYRWAGNNVEALLALIEG